jgi:hypothetical protein
VTIDITGIVESKPEQGEGLNNELSSDISHTEDQLKTAQARNIDANTRNTDAEVELKKDLANKTFQYMQLVGNFVATIVMLYIASLIGTGKEIPENFMIALVTTTLATVVGLVGFILKGLFSNK